MAQALIYLKNIYTVFLDLIFNQFDITGYGVTFGWIMMTIVIMSLMINSVLNLPKSANFRRINK